MNATNLSLQDVDSNLLKAHSLLKSCQMYIQEMRNNFESIEKMALSFMEEELEELNYDQSRKRKRNANIFFDERTDNEIITSGRDNFLYNVFYVICDKLISDMEARSNVYNEILEYYKPFFDISLDEKEIE